MSDISYTSSRSADVAQQRAPSRLGDVVFGGLARLAAIVTLLLLGGIIVSLIIASMPTIQKFGLGFLWQSEWDPNSDIYGALVPIYGTIVTSVIALVIAVPVSFGIALFLTELSPVWLRRRSASRSSCSPRFRRSCTACGPARVRADLRGIFPEADRPPVQDVWVLGPLTAGPPIGIGIPAAGVILAIMIIPYIASVMRDVFEVTPVLLKESAYGIGCTTWEVMWKVVLPYTKTGVIGGVMLGLGRALGETMAVTFVIGNTNLLDSVSLFAPGNSITSALANEFAEAQPGLHTSALMELGLILFVITFIVLTISKLLLLRLEKGEGKK